ncbi:response regulator transcription factor [Paenibacillus tepidiphilus]|uniref:response regulator transcription factor n=1 Tax=Paenibacillus tepidiphilus TaxID=2608683 RepID=UPI00123BA910|nr:response regulator transcription factor [Paenibacillus tepidiphilus]
MILIIEDSKDINHMLAEMLADAGYGVRSVYTGADGIAELQRREFSLVVLDLMLPFLSGDELLQEMRRFSEAPVMVISAKDQVDSKIKMLRLGADDYLTKPFDLGEVLARVESLLRRAGRSPEAAQIYTYKSMKLDDGLKLVTLGGEPLELTAKEYGILELLLKHRGKVFTKANLYERLWPEAEDGGDNAIKTHMSNLRSKLKKASPDSEYIETVWGLGYRLYKE